MSAGNHITNVRLDEEMLTAIEAAIASRNKRSKQAPWTLSDFIRQAIQDKLDHTARGNGTKRKKAKARDARSCYAQEETPTTNA